MDKLPIHLSQASGMPFYRQIVDQLAGLIRSGRLARAPGCPRFASSRPNSSSR